MPALGQCSGRKVLSAICGRVGCVIKRFVWGNDHLKAKILL